MILRIYKFYTKDECFYCLKRRFLGFWIHLGLSKYKEIKDESDFPEYTLIKRFRGDILGFETSEEAQEAAVAYVANWYNKQAKNKFGKEEFVDELKFE